MYLCDSTDLEAAYPLARLPGPVASVSALDLRRTWVSSSTWLHHLPEQRPGKQVGVSRD